MLTIEIFLNYFINNHIFFIFVSMNTTTLHIWRWRSLREVAVIEAIM